MVDHVVFIFQLHSVSYDGEYIVARQYYKFPKIRYIVRQSSFHIVYSSASTA